MSAPSEAPASAPPVTEPQAPTIAPAIEAEDDTLDDADSALGGSVLSSTTSIGSSILNYRKENGRSYHAYKDGKYAYPNDERENDRLDLQNHQFLLTFDGKLFTAPIPKGQQLHRVLDVGTGTGIWAIDFADEHPETQVLGVDLSPIQPTFTPPNVTFEVDDVEEDWNFHTKFDFIYSRMMTSAISDWPRYFSQALENLNEGGWMEVVDITFPWRSDDGTLLPDSAILKWNNGGVEASRILGRPCDSALQCKERMIAAGFENVRETVYRWPSNQWPKDKKLKEIGMWNNANITGGLEGLTLGLFTRGLGWAKEDVEVFLVDVRKELNDRKIHAWAPIVVVTGQKPKSS